jgi:hypothetical protein
MSGQQGSSTINTWRLGVVLTQSPKDINNNNDNNDNNNNNNINNNNNNIIII